VPKYSEILIVGCGNPLFADDGFGPAVIEEIQKLSLPDNICIEDAGLGGPHFIFPQIDPEVTKKLIIVCAADFNADPGTIAKFRVEDLPPNSFRDAHSADLNNPLQLIKDKVDIIILGCQPARIPDEMEIGISDEVSRAIPKTVQIILDIIGVDYGNAIRDEESKPQTDSTQKNIKPWDKGYKIQNRWEILDIKRGGMGIVYIARDHEWNRNFAIKTFQEKYLWDENVIQRFMAEAETWTKLDRHTNIVFANFVERIEGKPLLFLEYIDSGDLDRLIGKLSIEESLDFAIQFCIGMEYAYQKLGVIHRDIKPGNVMVQKDPRFRFGYAFKITDFGLVGVLGNNFQDAFVEISTGMGTLPFMPPEQFPEAIQDKFLFKNLLTTRSDIYSFGITLYFLLTTRLPFNDMNEIFTKFPERPKNLNPTIPEPLDILIIKCLEKNPDKRYTDFTELKEILMEIYADFTEEKYLVVGKPEKLTEIDWNNKAGALLNLGKQEDAIECYDTALTINPRSDLAWINKGLALFNLGKHQEAVECYDKSLVINPEFEDAWNNKGVALADLGKPHHAIECYDKALMINHRNANAWGNKGRALANLGKRQEALNCYEKALEINPRDAGVWNNKGVALANLGKLQEGIECFDKVLVINPRYEAAWNNKGFALANLGNPIEAIECYDKSLVINPEFEDAWNNKGVALANLGNPQEALNCYEKALEINPRDAGVWNNKGVALANLGNPQEALNCYEKALEINPRDAGVWKNKGGVLTYLGDNLNAIGCFEKFIDLAPPEYASQIEEIKKIINQLRR
jgi:coenzyme F420-reducing hydrogenase delta subunit-like protein